MPKKTEPERKAHRQARESAPVGAAEVREDDLPAVLTPENLKARPFAFTWRLADGKVNALFGLESEAAARKLIQNGELYAGTEFQIIKMRPDGFGKVVATFFVAVHNEKAKIKMQARAAAVEPPSSLVEPPEDSGAAH